MSLVERYMDTTLPGMATDDFTVDKPPVNTTLSEGTKIEQYSQLKKSKGKGGFLKRTWKAVKRPFRRSSHETKVEAIVPDTPVPCASGLQQKADREEISSQLSSVSGPCQPPTPALPPKEGRCDDLDVVSITSSDWSVCNNIQQNSELPAENIESVSLRDNEEQKAEQEQHAKGTCERTQLSVKPSDEVKSVEVTEHPLLLDTSVPSVSDLQQTSDREQISSQPSCVSGPSALPADSSAKETKRDNLQNNVKDEAQEQCAKETDEGTLLSFEPSDKKFTSVYEKKYILGSGSFGKVFMAIRKSDGREVAVKSIYSDIPISVAGSSKPVMTDVAMLIKLQQPPTSPYVIQMFEWFDYPDHIKIVMEYPAHCLELTKLICRHALNEQRVRVIMRQAAKAVKHCLDHGVFHNDIHTSNILVNTRTFSIKLIDFGCALEYKKGQLFPNHKYRGADDYRPPEVKAMCDFDGEKTNVFQLGKLLEKMCPGCRPGVSKRCRDLSSAWQAFHPRNRPAIEKLLEETWLENSSSRSARVRPSPPTV